MKRRHILATIAVSIWGLGLSLVTESVRAASFQENLESEGAAQLAATARQSGDPTRGAIVFFQPYMACSGCHANGANSQLLGPDLSRWEADSKPTDTHLVESVLHPSKSIRKGFETFAVNTESGESLVGLIVERNDDSVTLQSGIGASGKRVTLPLSEVADMAPVAQSVMPEQLVNQLSSRQQFLDLLSYLFEIRDRGPSAARRLEPAPHLYAARPLPAYESSIDHAGLIRDLDEECFERGQAIYTRLCVNCHGTVEAPGSLPTSLRFASGKFKNGHDPFTMYQTLTRGFGMMQPQAWMVPQQKYDVIHYIREAYLRPHNDDEYFDVTDKWLEDLPPGDTRGPEPQEYEPWVTMDYGSSLVNTYEVGRDGKNFAYKGIAVRLDSGPGGVSRGRHWMVFDHDTLRMAAAWSQPDTEDGVRFIDWKGIHFNGQHGIHPRVVGQLHAENPTGPGWSDPANGSWDDVRVVGRDQRQYGPLPREWARYSGLYDLGDRRIIAYQVGTAKIFEQPHLLVDGATPVFGRQLKLGERDHAITLQVAHLPEKNAQLHKLDNGAWLFGGQLDQPLAVATAAPQSPLGFDGRTYGEVEIERHEQPKSALFDMSSRSFTIAARIRTKQGGSLLAQTRPDSNWVPEGKVFCVRGGRLVYDIGWVGAVESRRSMRVNDNRWHNVAMTWDAKSSRVSFYVDGQPAGTGELRPEQKRGPADFVTRVGFAAADFPEPSLLKAKVQWLSFHQEALSQEQIQRLQPASELANNAAAFWNFADKRSRESGGVRSQTADKRLLRTETSSQPAGGGGELVRGGATSALAVELLGDARDAKWSASGGALRLTIPPGKPRDLVICFAQLESSQASGGSSDERRLDLLNDTYRTLQSSIHAASPEPIDLAAAQQGALSRWPDPVTTSVSFGDTSGPFAVDVLTRPATNPWLAQVRLTGFDFFADGDSLAICAWDGDVWHVQGLQSEEGTLQWRRIASGLFQPLGLRVIDETIYVTCRDQLVILRDLNGDGETDYYENLNNDHQVTEHFHEFAMGLQTDDAGNFYYAKSARHALPAIVPHHGTLLRVSKDGSETEILANGFRAANGVCLNPDGSFIVTDQEGHWNPKNRINWVRPGGFYGNMFGYHDVTDSSDNAMDQPLCWITNSFDRSPAELLWVPSGTWGPLSGSLLNLSYGYGKVFVVPHESIRDQMQGGMCELPIPQFPTGLVRGRFHPQTGDLYACGMFAWAGNQQQPGGFYRIRATGKPMHLPVGLRAKTTGIEIELSDEVDRASAEDPTTYEIKVWDLKRTANYGSKHYNERSWRVEQAQLSSDGKTVRLTVPDVQPTWGMEIKAYFKSVEGQAVPRQIHNTIHNLAD